MRESYLERKVGKWLNQYCGDVLLYFVKMERVGFPDRMLLLHGGNVVFIEFKAGKKYGLSEGQKEIRKNLVKGDFTYFVWEGDKPFEDVFRNLLLLIRTTVGGK